MNAPELLYADDWLLVWNKPAGLLAVPGRGPDKQDCLASRAQASHPGALVVHRLDMATSGLMLMARDATTQRQLGHAFEHRTVCKVYEAVAHGVLALPAGTPPDGWGEIDLPIAADWPRRPLRVIHPDGQPSQTRWRPLPDAGWPGHTRVALMPLTGRTHQLRVHLQALGHPLLGDALYAPEAVQALAPRLLLHARNLQLQHPATGAALHVDCPPPF